MPSMSEQTNEKRKQVADQCKVVAHLATVLAKVHLDYEELIQHGSMESILDTIGKRTARFMEDLGDALNGMDACTEEDDWTQPIFENRATFGFGPSDDV